MKKIIKWVLLIVLIVLLLPIVTVLVLFLSADMKQPELQISPQDYPTKSVGDTTYCNDSYLHQDSTGMWELYVEGSGQERGAVQGALTKNLMRYQEDVFINQIREIIPSDNYLSFLRVMLIAFNRNLGDYISLEYRDEIVAMSEFCTQEYNAIGTPYERQLNYHAAHDIGHAMQQYMLVGCSSFGVWGDSSSDGELIVGRNFDFYMGDDFAKHKIITFASPSSGYKYVNVGWAGMLGVLSGMNQKGLTVTINAAKGAIPLSAATPISILVREILQYASNIQEAYDIAAANQTFVSESILIGSASENCAVIIEKTPQKIAMYRVSDSNRISCTNHYQSLEFKDDSYNVENIEFSDSKYRFDRLEELLQSAEPIDHRGAIDVLRNRYGKSGKDVGIGNEMTLNQSIAHHAVVFKPQQAKMWVSTDPWQSGKFICYDLGEFFTDKCGLPIRCNQDDVAADSLFLENDYERLLSYRAGIKKINQASEVEALGLTKSGFVEEFMSYNPNHFYTYLIVGELYARVGDNARAIEMYSKALECEIPYKSERIDIEEIIAELKVL